MNFVPKNAVPRHDGAVEATSGEFAGWWTWTRDHYEVHNGPFWHRVENGKVRCVFRVEQKHINGGGAVHGGCLMTFADYCLFAIANTVSTKAAALRCHSRPSSSTRSTRASWSRAPVKSSAPGARSFLCAACSPRKAGRC